MLQLIIFLVCHPCWEIRRRAFDATRKIISAAPQLAGTLLIEFTNFLSLVAEKLVISKTRYIIFCTHTVLILKLILFLVWISLLYLFSKDYYDGYSYRLSFFVGFPNELRIHVNDIWTTYSLKGRFIAFLLNLVVLVSFSFSILSLQFACIVEINFIN